MNGMSTTILLSSGKDVYNIRCNSSRFCLDPSICATRETASSRCTSANRKFLSLSNRESETTLPEILGEVEIGSRGVALEPPLCVKTGSDRCSATAPHSLFSAALLLYSTSSLCSLLRSWDFAQHCMGVYSTHNNCIHTYIHTSCQQSCFIHACSTSTTLGGSKPSVSSFFLHVCRPPMSRYYISIGKCHKAIHARYTTDPLYFSKF